jgi:hypothetical protein
VIWKLFFSKSGEFGPFLPWKILCIGQNYIFQVEISPQKENTATNRLYGLV